MSQQRKIKDEFATGIEEHHGSYYVVIHLFDTHTLHCMVRDLELATHVFDFIQNVVLQRKDVKIRRDQKYYRLEVSLFSNSTAQYEGYHFHSEKLNLPTAVKLRQTLVMDE